MQKVKRLLSILAAIKFDISFYSFSALDAIGISTPSKPPPSGDQIDKMTFVSHL